MLGTSNAPKQKKLNQSCSRKLWFETSIARPSPPPLGSRVRKKGWFERQALLAPLPPPLRLSLLEWEKNWTKALASFGSRQINDHLRWVSTNRNVRIALSFTTLGSIKVVYNWFESVTLQHMITQLIDAPLEQSKKTMLRHKSIFVSALKRTTDPINHRF